MVRDGVNSIMTHDYLSAGESHLLQVMFNYPNVISVLKSLSDCPLLYLGRPTRYKASDSFSKPGGVKYTSLRNVSTEMEHLWTPVNRFNQRCIAVWHIICRKPILQQNDDVARRICDLPSSLCYSKSFMKIFIIYSHRRKKPSHRVHIPIRRHTSHVIYRLEPLAHLVCRVVRQLLQRTSKFNTCSAQLAPSTFRFDTGGKDIRPYATSHTIVPDSNGLPLGAYFTHRTSAPWTGVKRYGTYTYIPHRYASRLKRQRTRRICIAKTKKIESLKRLVALQAHQLMVLPYDISDRLRGNDSGPITLYLSQKGYCNILKEQLIIYRQLLCEQQAQLRQTFKLRCALHKATHELFNAQQSHPGNLVYPYDVTPMHQDESHCARRYTSHHVTPPNVNIINSPTASSRWSPSRESSCHSVHSHVESAPLRLHTANKIVLLEQALEECQEQRRLDNDRDEERYQGFTQKLKVRDQTIRDLKILLRRERYARTQAEEECQRLLSRILELTWTTCARQESNMSPSAQHATDSYAEGDIRLFNDISPKKRPSVALRTRKEEACVWFHPMVRQYFVELENHPHYCCAECKTHLALADDLVSEAFRGRTGTAWLFNTVVNVYSTHLVDRMMTTGLHTIADIYCKACHQNMGWKYEYAYEESQKYKRGKYILERDLLKLGDTDPVSRYPRCPESTASLSSPLTNPHRNSPLAKPDEHFQNVTEDQKNETSLSLTNHPKEPNQPLQVVDPVGHVTQNATNLCMDSALYTYSHFFPPPKRMSTTITLYPDVESLTYSASTPYAYGEHIKDKCPVTL